MAAHLLLLSAVIIWGWTFVATKILLTELGPVDFAAIARACGARGVRVEKDAEFEPALRAAITADRASVIQLSLDRRWVSVDEPAV